MVKFLKNILRIITAPFRGIIWFSKVIKRWIANVYKNIHTLLTEEPEDEPLPETFAKTLQNPMGLLFHLNELRKHLFRATLFLALTTVISFTYSSKIIDLLARPVGGMEALRAIDVTEPLGVFMRVALLSGFALALPYIAFEIWWFAAPGLKRGSRLFGLVAIPISTLFFLGGMAFAYFIMMPTAIDFLVNFMGMKAELRPSSYIRFVTSMLFWIGIGFEFPLVIYMLARIGLVSAKILIKQWRLAIVLIAVMAAVITPTVDPVSMALVMGPMTVLYFLSIGLAYIAQRRRS